MKVIVAMRMAPSTKWSTTAAVKLRSVKTASFRMALGALRARPWLYAGLAAGWAVLAALVHSSGGRGGAAGFGYGMSARDYATAIAEYTHAIDNRRFGRVLHRQNQILNAVVPRANRHWQCTAYRTNRAVERQFTNGEVPVESFERSHRTENRERHRQIES